MNTEQTDSDLRYQAPEATRIGLPPDFERSLRDAEILLCFAAEKAALGTISGGTVVDGILDARFAMESRALTKEVLRRFWIAVSDLSRIMGKVNAASLAASRCNPIRWLKLRVLVLVCLVVLGSIALFMNNSTAEEVMELINQQNVAALKLWSDLQYFRTEDASVSQEGALERRAFAGAAQPQSAAVPHLTPDELFGEIVEFSRKSNWLLETASRLNHWFNPSSMQIDAAPVKFDEHNPHHVTDINVPPEISTTPAIVGAGLTQIVAYQLIRNFSLAAYKTNWVFYGGITTYVLPAVYALLGATLYGFRLSARLIRNRSFLPSDAHSARYFIALIAGIVIGLFGSLVPKNLALPPLAVAFLVGYAVEVFFSRLDSLIARFRQDPPLRPPSLAQAEAMPAE